jgi:hypothetical protein
MAVPAAGQPTARGRLLLLQPGPLCLVSARRGMTRTGRIRFAGLMGRFALCRERPLVGSDFASPSGPSLLREESCRPRPAWDVGCVGTGPRSAAGKQGVLESPMFRMARAVCGVRA